MLHQALERKLCNARRKWLRNRKRFWPADFAEHEAVRNDIFCALIFFARCIVLRILCLCLYQIELSAHTAQKPIHIKGAVCLTSKLIDLET